MCQLLGMNCNVPTDICFSFEGFHRRGGLTDHHADGWGIAFFEGCGCRVFLDSRSAVESPIAALVRNYPIHSMNVIAHIRKATKGVVALENTHPFVRELTVDFSALTTPQDKVAMIATAPLTDNEKWTDMRPGELLVFRHGEAVLAA